jgi:hypothetical protein
MRSTQAARANPDRSCLLKTMSTTQVIQRIVSGMKTANSQKRSQNVTTELMLTPATPRRVLTRQDGRVLPPVLCLLAADYVVIPAATRRRGRRRTGFPRVRP